MPELICPHCQNVLRVRKVDNNTPYQCKQCYTPFYLNASGVAVMGAPPRVDEEFEALKQGARERLDRLPRRRIRNGVLAVIVIGLVGYLLMRPAQRLEGPGRRGRAGAGRRRSRLPEVVRRLRDRGGRQSLVRDGPGPARPFARNLVRSG